MLQTQSITPDTLALLKQLSAQPALKEMRLVGGTALALQFYKLKYPEYSEYRALLSLTYFDDAEIQPMPPLFISDTWEQMKNTIIQAVKQYQ